jgi:hypothetical protein
LLMARFNLLIDVARENSCHFLWPSILGFSSLSRML